jgi:hypothetical protein
LYQDYTRRAVARHIGYGFAADADRTSIDEVAPGSMAGPINTSMTARPRCRSSGMN